MNKEQRELDELLNKTIEYLKGHTKATVEFEVTGNQAKKFEALAKEAEKKQLNPSGLYKAIQQNKTSWVYKHTPSILTSRDAPFISAFGVVCAYDNKLGLAETAFSTIPGKAPQIVESKALLAYEQEEFDSATTLLESVPTRHLSDLGKLAYSLSLLNTNDTEVKKHYKILNNSTSDIAHRVLGTLLFNDEQYGQALNQFKKAWDKKKSETNLLNLLAGQRRMEATYAAEEFVAATAPYFLEAKSVPAQETIDSHIYKSSLDLPEFKLGKNLYKALLKLNKR